MLITRKLINQARETDCPNIPRMFYKNDNFKIDFIHTKIQFILIFSSGNKTINNFYLQFLES